MEILWVLTLLSLANGKLKIESLKDVTIYAEDLGEAQLYHQTWKLINAVESDNLYFRLHQVQIALEFTKDQCKGDCYEAREIQLLTGQLDRIKILHSNLHP